MSRLLSVHHDETFNPKMPAKVPDPHQESFSKAVLGFWMYLMTDCLLFASLFIAHAVLQNSTFGGPSSKDLFSLSTAFVETMVLLVSSVTCGLGILATFKGNKKALIGWFSVAFVCGASFVGIELHEFWSLVHEGHSWSQSAFLTSFFSLVGTHGIHVSIGLLWMAVVIAQVMCMGITTLTFRRLIVFSLFWHFLDLVWVFIFTFVYLLGVL